MVTLASTRLQLLHADIHRSDGARHRNVVSLRYVGGPISFTDEEPNNVRRAQRQSTARTAITTGHTSLSSHLIRSSNMHDAEVGQMFVRRSAPAIGQIGISERRRWRSTTRVGSFTWTHGSRSHFWNADCALYGR